jgi:hexosaminidase
MLALSLSCVIAGAVIAAEAPPDAADFPENRRWDSVMPLPAQREQAAGVWAAPPVVVVDWGVVPPAERVELGERLDLMLRPLSRSWKTGDGARLSFRGGPTGEAYVLTVSPAGVVVSASDAAGRFYALVTLSQLLPPQARAGQAVTASAGVITDGPRFIWRGLMVDSSRHFQSVETLEGILELMAQHKLNRFHWHLTDDQGWRLEVPGWPRLTEVGAWRSGAAEGQSSSGGQSSPYGGFYSAADIRRVVAFAAKRHIVVVPEVDLPGHSSAALAAYPELSASGRPRSVPTQWGVADGVLSLGRESVRRFTNDVLATLVELFPGPWIHWGGDEVYRTPWMNNAESRAWMRSVKADTPDEALAAFWADLARRTVAAGRVPVGWDEVSRLATPDETVVQWWDDPARALDALRQGHPLVASYKEASYLDYPELGFDGDRADWMPSLELDGIAAPPLWPPGTPEALRSRVAGLEAVLWTERAGDDWGRKLFPRLALLAEAAWRGVPGGVPGWRDRLAAHRDRLEAWGVGMTSPLR